MRWNPLNTVTVYAFLKPDSKARIEDLNRRIATMLKNREGIERMATRAAQEDVSEFDASNSVGFPMARVAYIELLQSELKLRNEIAEIWETITTEGKPAYSAAIDRHQAERSRIEKALLKLGYLPIDSLERGRITPGMINNHPAVITAVGEEESLLNSVNGGSQTAGRTQNSMMIELLTDQLTRYRDQAAAVPA